MRPLLALILSSAILLGVRAYLQFAASLRGTPVHYVADEQTAAGTFSAEITLTFDAAADEFSLHPIALVFKHQQRVLLEREGKVAAGTPLVIDNISGIKSGPNAFFVECTPQADGAAQSRAVRVRLLRDGMVVADQTLWAAPGQVPRGEILLDVPVVHPTKPLHDHS